MSEEWSPQRWAIVCFVLFVVGIIIGSQAKIPIPPPAQNEAANLKILFIGCKQEVIRNINRVNNTLYIAANVITDPDIATALLGAKARAVNVTIIIEEEQMLVTGTQIQKLQKELRVIVDVGKGVLGSTFMVMDSKVVVTGSYQWAPESETDNVKDLVVIRDVKMAGVYLEQWMNIYNTRRR